MRTIKIISVSVLLGGLLTLSASTAVAQVAQDEITLVNPTSKAKLWATVFSPADAGKDKKYPAVVFVPGGVGFGSGMARTPLPRDLTRAGFVLGMFDPDGRGRSEGKEDFNGKVHQDGLHAFLKHIADLPQVQKDNIGVFSSSLGLAMAAGTLGRYPDDPKVKYFIDDEGPTDRFYITKWDTLRIGGHSTKDEAWWAEREAVRSIKEVRCAYLRIQRELDHIHAENKQHALDMINAATQEKFGGKGKAPWTRINGDENKANRTYTKDQPPKWLPARAGGPPGGEETLKWIRELSAPRDQPKPKEEGGQAPGDGRTQAANGQEGAAATGAKDTVPEGAGIAAKYPGDAGIATDPAVLFADNFESGDMKKWDQQRGRVVMTEDKPNSGRWCAQMPMERGKNHGGDAINWFMPGADAVFARFYVKFSPDYQYNHHFVWLGANQRTNKWSAFGKAGLKPNGTYYSTGMEPWFAWGRNPPPGEVNLYTYYLDMELDRKMNKYWGNGFFPPGPDKGKAAGPARVIPPLNQWQCWEFMIQANTAPDKADGKQAMWVEGKLIGEFTGIRWRNDMDLKVNCLWLEHYGYDEGDPTKQYWKDSQSVWFDDVVVARRYIGPIQKPTNKPKDSQ